MSLALALQFVYRGIGRARRRRHLAATAVAVLGFSLVQAVALPVDSADAAMSTSCRYFRSYYIGNNDVPFRTTENVPDGAGGSVSFTAGGGAGANNIDSVSATYNLTRVANSSLNISYGRSGVNGAPGIWTAFPTGGAGIGQYFEASVSGSPGTTDMADYKETITLSQAMPGIGFMIGDLDTSGNREVLSSVVLRDNLGNTIPFTRVSGTPNTADLGTNAYYGTHVLPYSTTGFQGDGSANYATTDTRAYIYFQVSPDVSVKSIEFLHGGIGLLISPIWYTACYDYGDAPASYGDAFTRLSETYRLGAAVDQDLATYPAPGATGDGHDDGVSLPASFTRGQQNTIDVSVLGNGHLNGWIDYNGDGTFDTGEQIATDVLDNSATDLNPAIGSIRLQTTPPLSASPGTSYARFRWASVNGVGATGQDSTAGEVEDYQVTIANLLPVADDVTNPGLVPDTGSPTPIAALSASDADGSVASYTLTSAPANGTLTLPDGTVVGTGTVLTDTQAASLRFTPTAGYTGPVTFQFTATDNNGGTDATPATYTLTVGPPPVQTLPDSTITPQNITTTLTPLANDNPTAGYAIDPVSLQVVDPVTGTAGSSVTVPGQGTWTVNADRTVTFDPLPGFTGNATVQYQIASTSGFTTSQSMTVTVTPITPTAVADAVVTPADTTVTVPLLGNDDEGASSAPLVASSVQVRDPADSAFKDVVLVAGVGTWTANDDGSVTFDPVPGYSGTAAVDYRVLDSNATAATSTVSVRVKIAPAAADDAASTPQNVTVSLSPLANDTPGADASWDVGSLRLVEPGTGNPVTSVTVPGQGTWTVGAGGTVSFDPLPGFTGPATPLSYRVADTDGLTVAASLSVNVTAISPTATNDTASTLNSHPVTVDVLANDASGAASALLDPDSVQILDPADQQYKDTVTVPNLGTWTANPNGTVSFAPASGFEGDATATYRVADSNGTTATATVTVNVVMLPHAVNETATTQQNVTVSLSPLANDLPSDGATWDAGTLRLIDPGTHAAVTSLFVAGEGTWTVNADGTVSFDPLPGYSGAATPVDYTVQDSLGESASATLAVQVTPVTPSATDDAGVASFNKAVTIDVLANDDAGSSAAPLDPTSVRLLDPADGQYKTSVAIAGQGTWTANADGTVTFTPAAGFSGEATPLRYRVSDSNGSTANAEVAVRVGVASKATPDNSTGKPGQPVTVNPLTNDTPTAGATWVADSLCLVVPASGDCVKQYTDPKVGTWTVNDDGTVTFTSVSGFSGVATIGYQLTDSNGVTVSSQIQVRISASTPTPTTTPTPSATPTPVSTGTPTPTGTSLARTGAQLSTTLMMGLILLGAGTILVGRGRRRRRGARA